MARSLDSVPKCDGKRSNQWKSMEIQGHLSISIEINDSWARKFGILWQPVAPSCRPSDAPKKPLQDGRHQIIRSSVVGIIGWSDLGDHQWSDLRTSAVCLCCQGLTGQMVDDERNDDETIIWKKFPHARAWGARGIFPTRSIALHL